MKKLFNLQLFAEEGATETPSATSADSTATEQESTTAKEETKPATAAKEQKKVEEKVFTHADFDRLFNQKYAELQKKAQKEIDEATKLANMNAEEKANYEKEKLIKERDEVIKERDELKKAASLTEMTKTARKMLADNGVNVSDELLTMFVSTDAENTKAAVDSFSKLFKEAVESGVKDRLRGETPKTGTVSTAPISEFEKRMKKYT
jgi:hypothetical protein